MKKIVLVLGAICTMTLVGCVSAPKSLYSWGEYPQQTYLMLSLPEKTSPQEQIGKLEKDIEKAKAKKCSSASGLVCTFGFVEFKYQ